MARRLSSYWAKKHNVDIWGNQLGSKKKAPTVRHAQPKPIIKKAPKPKPVRVIKPRPIQKQKISTPVKTIEPTDRQLPLVSAGEKYGIVARTTRSFYKGEVRDVKHGMFEDYFKPISRRRYISYKSAQKGLISELEKKKSEPIEVHSSMGDLATFEEEFAIALLDEYGHIKYDYIKNEDVVYHDTKVRAKPEVKGIGYIEKGKIEFIDTDTEKLKTTYIIESKVKGSHGRFLPYREGKGRYSDPKMFSTREEAEEFANNFGSEWQTRVRKIEYKDIDSFARMFW